MKKVFRLKRKKDIELLMKIKKSVGNRYYAIYYTESEQLKVAVSASKKLGNAVQVVSVLSVADFRKQDVEYKKQMLAGLVVAIEAAASAPWFEFADVVFGIDAFGASGDGMDVYQKFGFDADIIVADIKNKIKYCKYKINNL